MNMSAGRIERWALGIMVVVALAMSARALYEMGRAAGLGELSIGLPVILDGFAILAARVVARLSGKARLYPWLLLIGLGAISVWANAIHASPVRMNDLELTLTQAQFLSALPPVALGLAYHMFLMVGRVATQVDDPAAEPIAELVNTPVPEVAKPRRKAPVRGGYETKARKVWADELANGHEPSGHELARLIGSSPATGKRLAAMLRAERNGDSPE